jgi:hypothetical protein
MSVIDEEPDLSLLNTSIDGISTDVLEIGKDVRRQTSFLDDHHSQVSSSRGVVNISQFTESSHLTSPSSSFSPSFCPLSPSVEAPVVVAYDVQLFNDLIKRNKDSDLRWKVKTIEDVYSILNDTVRLEMAILSPNSTLIKELR